MIDSLSPEHYTDSMEKSSLQKCHPLHFASPQTSLVLKRWCCLRGSKQHEDTSIHRSLKGCQGWEMKQSGGAERKKNHPHVWQVGAAKHLCKRRGGVEEGKCQPEKCFDRENAQAKGRIFGERLQQKGKNKNKFA